MNQFRREKCGLVTTEFVLLEVANSLSRSPFRNLAVSYINGLKRLRPVQIVAMIFFSEKVVHFSAIIRGTFT